MSDGVHAVIVEQNSSEDSWTDAEEEPKVNCNQFGSKRTPSIGPVDFSVGEITGQLHARSISSPHIFSTELKRSPRKINSETVITQHYRSFSGGVKPQILNSNPISLSKHKKNSRSGSFHRSFSRQDHRSTSRNNPSIEDIKQLHNHNRSHSRQSRQSDTGGSSLASIGHPEYSSNSFGHTRGSHSLSSNLTTNSSATLHAAFHDLQKKEEQIEHSLPHRLPSIPHPHPLDFGGDQLIRNLDTGEEFHVDDERIDTFMEGLTLTEIPKPISRLNEKKEYPEKKIQKNQSWIGRLFTTGEAETKKIIIKKKGKNEPFLSNLYLQQTIPNLSPITVMKFNKKDHNCLATGSEDGIIRLWTVVGTHADARRYSEDDVMNYERSTIINPVPYREFSGHRGKIIDLCWAKLQNLILSASEDSTVMLWHGLEEHCLGCFKHVSPVTCVQFHPIDESLFLTGSLDYRIRLWDIHERRVQKFKAVDNLISAVVFSPNGKFIVVGLYNGECLVYRSDQWDCAKCQKINANDAKKCTNCGRDRPIAYGFQEIRTLDCKNRYGKYKNGRRITSLQYSPTTSMGEHQSPSLLVASNDHRIRLFKMGEDYEMLYKYKGLTNLDLSIGANFSEDGKHIISGSEDQHVYIWQTEPSSNTTLFGNASDRNENYVFFKENNSVPVPVAIFTPKSIVEFINNTVDYELDQIIVTADAQGMIKFFCNTTTEEQLSN